MMLAPPRTPQDMGTDALSFGVMGAWRICRTRRPLAASLSRPAAGRLDDRNGATTPVAKIDASANPGPKANFVGAPSGDTTLEEEEQSVWIIGLVLVGVTVLVALHSIAQVATVIIRASIYSATH